MDEIILAIRQLNYAIAKAGPHSSHLAVVEITLPPNIFDTLALHLDLNTPAGLDQFTYEGAIVQRASGTLGQQSLT